MKIEFLTENIERFLPQLVKIIPSHTQVSVLSNILLEANDSQFFMTATDLEIGLRVKVPAKIESSGATTVSGKHFYEVVSALAKGKVSLSLEGEKLALVSPDGKISFQTIPQEEFPQIYEEKGEKVYSFGDGELESIFNKVIFVASQDESRPELTGIYLAQSENHLDFVATDGFRLSLKKVPRVKIIEEGTGLILSSKLMHEALSLKEENLEMYVFQEANQVLFESGETVLVGRLISGSFPNYERVIPTSLTTRAVIEKEDFLHALRLVSVFARESANIVKLKVANGKILFIARSSGVGEGEIKIDVEQTGEDAEISFNVKFLLDLLKNIEEKKLVMEMTSALEPALFTIPSDKNFLHVIMPVRVQE